MNETKKMKESRQGQTVHQPAAEAETLALLSEKLQFTAVDSRSVRERERVREEWKRTREEREKHQARKERERWKRARKG